MTVAEAAPWFGNQRIIQGTSMAKSMKIVMTAASLLAAALTATGAAAADITVIGSTAMTEFIQAVIPMFEHESGHKVRASFLSGSVLPVKVKEGAPADLIVTTPESIDDLVKAGKVVAGSRVDFVRSGAGVAVRAGAPKPDIGTPGPSRRPCWPPNRSASARGRAAFTC
jgi:molybdate transport system substrate-binding protein